MSYNSLVNYYKTNFALFHIHKYPLDIIENMIPFEREIYVQMLVDHIENQNKSQEVEDFYR